MLTIHELFLPTYEPSSVGVSGNLPEDKTMLVSFYSIAKFKFLTRKFMKKLPVFQLALERQTRVSFIEEAFWRSFQGTHHGY